MGWFGSLINVCAFTGYLLAAAAVPAYLLSLYVTGLASWVESVLLSLPIVFMAVVHFFHGVMGFGGPKAISRTIGSLLLLPVAIRLIVPVQRFFRAHPLLFVPVACAIGIGLAISVAFAFAAPVEVPLRITDRLGHTRTIYIATKSDDYSFYTGKTLLEFKFWDWLAAGAGALVYLGAVTFWRNLLKPSTPEPKAN